MLIDCLTLVEDDDKDMFEILYKKYHKLMLHTAH